MRSNHQVQQASSVRDEISPPPTKRRKLSKAFDGSAPDPTLPPSALWLRIYSWNINGVVPFIQPSITSYLQSPKSRGAQAQSSSVASLRGFLRRHHWPQILNLQEVKISPSDTRSQRAVEKAVNLCKNGGADDGGPQYIVKFSLPRDKYNATGFGRKLYGVATIMRLDFFEAEVNTVREVTWDLEGRCLIIETESKFAVFNLYCVNGTESPYRDPLTGKVIGTRHDRKLAFHRSLLDECKQLESKGYSLVLSGDMNVACQAIDGFPKLRTKPEQHCINRQDFNNKFFDSADGLRAIDSFRYLHPELKKYTYLPRSRDFGTSGDRVDLIIVSRSLVEGKGRLAEADVLMSVEERGLSDHTPLFISIDRRPQ